MTKKNILLATFGTLCLTALFAFTAPKAVREDVFTLFFPEKTPPTATERRVEVKKPAQDRLDIAATVRDTPPPLQERFDDFINGGNSNPVDLQDPKAIQQEVEYDPETNMYIITEKIGDEFYRAPTYMTFDDYLKWREQEQQREYFDRLQGISSGGKSGVGLDDPIAKFDVKTSLIDRLFGGTNVDIRPQGNINLTFGYNYQKIQNPILTLRQQNTGNFDFDMDINMSATGKIGEKLNLNFNYNTQATFDFDNQMKLHYDTK
ncbi:MAG TPA: cell surface protein SprA, partial [Saprospiraceae bacterium]|nr:cell surface protein SprA [Saprospiraceae bacterium]